MNSTEASAAGVLILPEATALPIQLGKSLLELCLAHRIPITHACGGLARCSTCRVVILEGGEHCTVPNEAERELADRFGFDEHVRLACQARVSGPAQIRRLVLDENDMQFVEGAASSETIDALGEEIVVAMLFCDIRGFTRFSRRVMPYDAIHLLNRFYAALGPQIAKHGGEINNTMGDGFLALFAQTDESAACRAAVQAGRAMLQVLPALSDYSTRAYGEPLRIGIGIHSGPVICGSIGHGASRRTTVIGDNVNFASRIESATKQLDRPLLVSARVRDLLETEFTWTEAGKATLPGIGSETTLYSPTAFAAGDQVNVVSRQ